MCYQLSTHQREGQGLSESTEADLITNHVSETIERLLIGHCEGGGKFLLYTIVAVGNGDVFSHIASVQNVVSRGWNQHREHTACS